MENMESSVQKPAVAKIDLRPKILELIKNNGPLVPRDISKEIGQNTFITGAMLAQLRDSGEILASNTKVGGSPAYYVQGQEENLQILEKFLDQKSREAYLHLKENIILRDYEQSTQDRFCLRQLKDFAVDLTVEVRGVDEIFWKWYLTPIDEAEKIIMSIINEENEIIRQKELIESKKKEAIDKVKQEEFIEAEIQRRLKEKLDKLEFERNELEKIRKRNEIKEIELKEKLVLIQNENKTENRILETNIINLKESNNLLVQIDEVNNKIKEKEVEINEILSDKSKKDIIIKKIKETINNKSLESVNESVDKISIITSEKLFNERKAKKHIAEKIDTNYIKPKEKLTLYQKIKKFLGLGYGSRNNSIIKVR